MSNKSITPHPGAGEQLAELPDSQPGFPTQATSGLPAEGGGIQWSRYISAVRRYRWLVLAIALVGSAGGVVATRFIEPSFTARATIWIQNDAGRSGGGPLRPGELLPEAAWDELLRTFVVYDAVVTKMHLHIRPTEPGDSVVFRGFDLAERYHTGLYKLQSRPGNRWALLRNGNTIEEGVVGDSIGRTLGWRWAPSATDLGTRSEVAFEIMDIRSVSNTLNGQLTATISTDGNFLRVGLTGSDRNQLAPVLNAITREFVDLAADLKKHKLVEMRLALDSQVTVSYENLRRTESALRTFQINTITQPRNGVLPVSPGLVQTQGSATQTYFTQKIELDRIRQDRQQLEAVLTRGKSGDLAPDAFQTIPSVRNAPALVQALNDLTVREAELRALRARYTDQHPLVQQVLANTEELRTRFIPTYAQALIDQLRSQEEDIQSRISRAGTELREVPAVTINEMRLQREYESAQQLYRNLEGRQQEARLAELSAQPDVRIIDAASTPFAPAGNKAIRIIMISVVGSLIAGISLALFLDQLDRRFRYPEQVSQEIGLPILGAIPAIKSSKSPQTPEDLGQVKEAFRTVRLNLAHSFGAAGPVLLTVTSPGAGDGKSLVASNLAVSFAEAGYRTLLIDGDIRRGELHRMFAQDRRPGLLDFLTRSSPLDAITRATFQRGLSLIPCGSRRQEGPELLGSKAMADLMAEMKSQYNVVIVDSPPLGAGIDPFVLGTTTGHLLMVFRTGETDREMAVAKLRMLDRLPVRVLGAVLNDVNPEGQYRYYSYLYGYSVETDDQAGAPALPPTSREGQPSA
jgi:capsular exopolysaccharide synthesis family protein